MDKKVKFAQLVAKTGAFFGAVDGEYSDNERAFVNLFIGILSSQCDVDTEVEKLLAETTSKKYELSEVINETKQALEGMDEKEKKDTIDNLSILISSVINADGKQAEEENNAFSEWKKAMGI